MGQGESRLRPPTPGLFEPAPGVGAAPDTINEVVAETVAAAPPQPETRPAPNAKGHPAADVDQGSIDVPAPPVVSELELGVPEIEAHSGPTHLQYSESARHSDHPPPARSIPTPEPAQAEPFNPPETPKSSGRVTYRSLPAEPPPSITLEPSPSADPNDKPSPKPPDAAPTPEQLNRIWETPRPVSATALTATPATAEPDIHIHIGRLEVRTASAAPSNRQLQSQPRKRANTGQSLSDYLKGRG